MIPEIRLRRFVNCFVSHPVTGRHVDISLFLPTMYDDTLMTPGEARELASRLIKYANEADRYLETGVKE